MCVCVCVCVCVCASARAHVSMYVHSQATFIRTSATHYGDLN
jgi:hypothetical protein